MQNTELAGSSCVVQGARHGALRRGALPRRGKVMGEREGVPNGEGYMYTYS